MYLYLVQIRIRLNCEWAKISRTGKKVDFFPKSMMGCCWCLSLEESHGPGTQSPERGILAVSDFKKCLKTGPSLAVSSWLLPSNASGMGSIPGWGTGSLVDPGHMTHHQKKNVCEEADSCEGCKNCEQNSAGGAREHYCCGRQEMWWNVWNKKQNK